jgi:methionyl-tRNA formyltransferase
MNYIFFGTPSFSARCLEILLDHGMMPMAVVCNPDRPVGRKHIITPPPVKQLIADRGSSIPVFQPEKLDAEFQEKLKSFNPDFFVVFAYNKIFRKETLDIPRLGTVGVHPSFLPKYRGSSPFQTALLNGETETGVTLYLLDSGIDSGPILARSEPVAITDTDTFDSLAKKLSDIGGDLLVKILPSFYEGKITPMPQNETDATFTKKFKTEDGFVEPDDLAAAENGNLEQATYLDRKIRALNPEPGAWTMRDGKRLKLLEAKILNNTLRLTVTQREGEKPKRV